MPTEYWDTLLPVMPRGWTGFTSYADLCLHRYYGGNARESLGGVCIAQEPNLYWSRQLSFPYEFRSPFFSADGVERSRFRRNPSPAILKGLCSRHCQCADSQSPKQNAKLTSWQRLAIGGDLQDSDSADSWGDGWSRMSDSEEDRAQAFQASLEKGTVSLYVSYDKLLT